MVWTVLVNGRDGWCPQKGVASVSAACVQVHFSSQALFDHLMQIQNDDAALVQFADTLLSILRDNLHNDRYTPICSTGPEAFLQPLCRGLIALFPF